MSDKPYDDAPDYGDPLLYAVDVPEDDRRNMADSIADRYEVRSINGLGGCIIWGRYRGREWYANVSARWLVKHLISELAKRDRILAHIREVDIMHAEQDAEAEGAAK